MNIQDLEKELVHWGQELYIREKIYGKAEAEFVAIDAVRKIKFASIEAGILTEKSEKAKERQALLSNQWITFNNEHTEKEIAKIVAKSDRDAVRGKFESVRSVFSLRKAELSMLGTEFDNSNIRG